MATSGSVDYNRTRDQVITEALQEMTVLSVDESPSTNDVTFMASLLNRLLKRLQARAPHLWKRKRGYIFIESEKYEYKVGDQSTDDRCFNSYVTTTLTADSAASDTTLTVDDITGFSDTNLIGVSLDDGSIHWTTINGAPSGSTITLTSGVATAASSGNRVYAGSSRIHKPLKIYKFWREQIDSSGNTTRAPLNSISLTDFYGYYGNSQIDATPSMACFDYKAQVNTTDPVLIRIMPAALSTSNYIVGFIYESMIEDVDSSSDNLDLPTEGLDFITLWLAKRACKAYAVPADIRRDIDAEYLEAKAELDKFDSDDEPFVFIPPWYERDNYSG